MPLVNQIYVLQTEAKQFSFVFSLQTLENCIQRNPSLHWTEVYTEAASFACSVILFCLMYIYNWYW